MGVRGGAPGPPVGGVDEAVTEPAGAAARVGGGGGGGRPSDSGPGPDVNRRAKAASSRARAAATASARAPSMVALMARSAAAARRRWRASARASSTTRPSGTTRRAMPAADRLLRRQPGAGEQDLSRPLPAHAGGEQVAAGGLGGHAHLRERGAEPGALGYQDQVAVGSNVKPMPTATPLTAATSGLSNACSASSRTGKPESISSPAASGPSRPGPGRRRRPGRRRSARPPDRVVGPGGVERGTGGPVERRVEGVERRGRSRVSRRTVPRRGRRPGRGGGSDTPSGWHAARPPAAEGGDVGPGGAPVGAVAPGPVAARCRGTRPRQRSSAHVPKRSRPRSRNAMVSPMTAPAEYSSATGPRATRRGGASRSRRGPRCWAGARGRPAGRSAATTAAWIAAGGGVEHGPQGRAQLGQRGEIGRRARSAIHGRPANQARRASTPASGSWGSSSSGLRRHQVDAQLA